MDERILALISPQDFAKIKKAHILLVGVGGVGGFAFEALVRSGFQNIAIIDGDNIDLSNLNRQIITNQTNIGLSKVEEAKKRALSINPNINIQALNVFLTKENILNYLQSDYDYIIDACDDINIKIALIKYAQDRQIKIITSLGTAKKLYPQKIEITKLNKTFNDPLAKKLRYELKKENLSLNIPVVFSSELPLKTSTLGSLIFVPACSGIYLANYVFQDLLN